MTATRLVRRYASLWPLLNWGLFALALAFIIGALLGVIPYGHGTMGDGSAFYYVQTPYDWSDRPPGVAEYRYSPAFLWVTAPLRLLPFEGFVAVWTALHVIAVAWLAPWMLAFPGVADDIISGNINTFLALGAVLAVKGHPWTWALPLLTKVTPGVGVLYHLPRREWRAMGIAIGTTTAIVIVGVAVQPALWGDWFASLRLGPDTYRTTDILGPLVVRIPIAVAICLLSARRAWLLPVGMIVAVPGLWPSSFAMLAAVPRLARGGRSSSGLTQEER